MQIDIQEVMDQLQQKGKAEIAVAQHTLHLIRKGPVLLVLQGGNVRNILVSDNHQKVVDFIDRLMKRLEIGDEDGSHVH